MMQIRHHDQRGVADFGWLYSQHSFSFGHYYDPQQMGFGPLRVINDDRVIAGAGFDTHAHQDMEIISYVLEGALEHKDSIGTGSVIRPGELQRMSAGTGIMHSEYNHSQEQPVHFLQIWVQPERKGLSPGYEQKAFPDEQRQGKLRLVGSRDGRDNSVTIHQDVDLYASLLARGETIHFSPREDRKLWVQVARGEIQLNGEKLLEGDGVAIHDEPELKLVGLTDAEVLLFDMGD